MQYSVLPYGSFSVHVRITGVPGGREDGEGDTRSHEVPAELIQKLRVICRHRMRWITPALDVWEFPRSMSSASGVFVSIADSRASCVLTRHLCHIALTSSLPVA